MSITEAIAEAMDNVKMNTTTEPIVVERLLVFIQQRDHELAHAHRLNAEAVQMREETKQWRACAETLAEQLSRCAGYIASVRTDRQITWNEGLYALQTVEWADGAVEIADEANESLADFDRLKGATP